MAGLDQTQRRSELEFSAVGSRPGCVGRVINQLRCRSDTMFALSYLFNDSFVQLEFQLSDGSGYSFLGTLSVRGKALAQRG